MAAISDMVPPRWFTQDFTARQPAAVAFVVDMLLGTDPAGYAGCGEAIAAMDLRPALGAIKAPTLVAVPEPESQLRFDIFLQGERETVFFDV